MPEPDLYAAAVSLAGRGQFAEGLATIRQRLAASAPDAASLALMAAFLVELGQPAEALAACDQALALDAAYAAAYSNRADALRQLKRPEPALADYDRALALQPALLSALVNRGLLLLDAGRPADALASYDAALAVNPSVPQALYGRGHALTNLGRDAEALDSLDRALALRPGHLNTSVQRAIVLDRLLRHEDALTAYAAVAAMTPRNVNEAIGIGLARHALGRYQDAIAAFDAAAPAPEAVYQRGLIRLLLGDFEAGWRDYEARWDTELFRTRSSSYVPEAVRSRLSVPDRAADLEGQAVVLLAEQGIGDQVMFASMLPDVLATAGQVTCICDHRLAGLFQASFPDAAFVDVGQGRMPDVRFDRLIAMGSLGRLYRNRPADFPGAAYLRPRPDVAADWAARLGPRSGRLRVGLSWRGGSVRTEQASRSLTLDQLGPLLQIPGCEFVSLQYGDVAEEVAAANRRLGCDLRLFAREEIEDFEQLAGLIAGLDLVVSVQTSVVHLSGALGKDCLSMVPVRPEWRYGAGSAAMPWYGSVRLLRQRAHGDWQAVLDAVAAELRRRAA